MHFLLHYFHCLIALPPFLCQRFSLAKAWQRLQPQASRSSLQFSTIAQTSKSCTGTDDLLSSTMAHTTHSSSFSLRRTNLADCATLAKLANAETEALFGSYNLVTVVEKAIFSITAVDDKDIPLGFLALYDAPDVAGVPQSRLVVSLLREVHKRDANEPARCAGLVPWAGSLFPAILLPHDCQMTHNRSKHSRINV